MYYKKHCNVILFNVYKMESRFNQAEVWMETMSTFLETRLFYIHTYSIGHCIVLKELLQ